MSVVFRSLAAAGILAISATIQADPATPVPPNTDVSGVFLKAVDNPDPASANLDSVMSQALNSKLPPANSPVASPATTATTTNNNDLQQIKAEQQNLQSALRSLQQQDIELKRRLDQLIQQLSQLQASASAGTNASPEQQKMQQDATQLKNQKTELEQRIANMTQAPQQTTATVNTQATTTPATAPAPAATTVTTQTTTTTAPAPTSAASATATTPANPVTVAPSTAAPSTTSTTVTETTPAAITPDASALTVAPEAANIAQPAPTAAATDTTSNAPELVSPPPGNDAPAFPSISEAVNTTTVPAPSAITVATPEEQAAPAAALATAKSGTIDLTNILATLESWAHDPAVMLRIGGGLVILAFLLLIRVFWPKKRRVEEEYEDTDEEQDEEQEEFFEEETPEEPIINKRKQWGEVEEPVVSTVQTTHATATAQQTKLPEEEELELEYDLMESDDAASIRLDLARAYLEMQNYPEAREALELVFESGTPQQKQHAKRMLQQIEAAEAGV